MKVGYKRLGSFSIEEAVTSRKIDTKLLKAGINDNGKHFISLNEKGEIIYVLDKICNHAGGRLILKGDKAVCPLHSWELDLSSLKYNHSHVCKEPLNYELDADGFMIVNETNSFLRNPFIIKQAAAELKFRWLNHATVFFEFNGVSIITDPWLLGPAFMTGWWLASPSPEESIYLLKKADFIFISHNHPDHLHAETLSHIPKNKCILVPNFLTKSCENSLKSLGFTNVNPLDFNEIFEIAHGFQLSILKSGDFRDDSGLYLAASNVEALLTVDSNLLNNFVLPNNIDLLMTSFAGGASGFPICYENYSPKQKHEIIKRNRDSVVYSVAQHMKATKPRHYMPYAGMFKESAPRDAMIRSMNEKNDLSYIQHMTEKNGINFLAPDSSRVYKVSKNEVNVDTVQVVRMPEENIEAYIAELKQSNPFDVQAVIQYLKNSGYHGPQIVQIIPTDDEFKETVGEIIFADFEQCIFKTIFANNLKEDVPNYRVMILKIRSEILMSIVKNRLPWEDFSIGFQMRVKRFPNLYESDFWYHFTNVYIA